MERLTGYAIEMKNFTAFIPAAAQAFPQNLAWITRVEGSSDALRVKEALCAPSLLHCFFL